METMARVLVQVHYRELINLTLDFSHNSQQLQKLIAANVMELLDQSLFHAGLVCDPNVRFVYVIIGITDIHILGPHQQF